MKNTRYLQEKNTLCYIYYDFLARFAKKCVTLRLETEI